MQKNGLRELFWHLFHYQLSKTVWVQKHCSNWINSWILILIQFFASFNSNGHDLLMISITSNEFSTDVNVRNGTKRQKIIRHDDPISLLDDKWWPVQFSRFVLWVYAVLGYLQGREVLKPVFRNCQTIFAQMGPANQQLSLRNHIVLELQEILKNSSGEDFKKANNLKNHKRT